MDRQSLTDYLAEHPMPTDHPLDDGVPRAWYNEFGDSLEFQTEHVATVADRLADYLTIYRSAETDSVVGFQIKDVTALLKRTGSSELQVMVGVKDNRIIKMDLGRLFLLAFEAESSRMNTHKRQAYHEAWQTLVAL